MKGHEKTITDESSLRELVIVAGVPFDNLNMAEALDRIESFITDGQPHYVVTANVNFVVTANRDPEFMDVVRMADLITADGMPIVWTSRLLGTPLKERVTGTDLIYDLAGLAEEKGYRLFFLGGEPGVSGEAVARLKAMHPGLMASFFSPDFDPLLKMKNYEIRNRILDFVPDVLLVSLGAGKAEKWIRMNMDWLEAPVSIGVGAAVDFISGRKKRAPLWMRERGQEWVYRMFQEPWRLGRRYIHDYFFYNYYTRRQIHAQKRCMLSAPDFAGNNAWGSSISAGRSEIIPVDQRLDLANSAGLTARGQEVLDGGKKLILNLSKTLFIDSSGLGALAALEKHSRRSGTSFILAGPSPGVLKIIKQARMEGFFEMTKSNFEANSIQDAKEVIRAEKTGKPGVLEISLAGRLDAEISKELKHSLFELVRRKEEIHTVRLDMREVAFIDSSGLSVLIALHKRLTSEGKTLGVINLAGDASRVFKIMKMDKYLQVA